MTNDINNQVKSTTDLYYDFFCLLHLPVICSVDKSAEEEEEQSSQSCPINADFTNATDNGSVVKSNS